ncbi:MAG TPA: alpha/beta fold hydrolase [Pyrinomonadaceae bacterium]|jgi:medium-chain acyl-[acyl-carrier-protein] hydrolase|nr:alpha/beta fold hydrolase [Pyrinomonadaceae bacterium]
MSGATGAAHGLAYYKPRPEATLRLFCFPYAGGSALIYRQWADQLPPQVEVCAVQLPGRGHRIREAPLSRMAPLAALLARDIRPLLDKPFAFFGHSMGATISFELARLLRRDGAPQPSHLFVSGRSAPQVPDTDPPTYDLPEPEFIEHLRRLNGTPPEVFDEPDLLRVMLPLVRADFEVIQTYAYEEEPPLDCPITVYGGLLDGEVKREHLDAWCAQTKAPCAMRLFPGDHFFINANRDLLLQTLTRDLYEHRLL